MTTALVPVNDLGIAPSRYATPKVFKSLTSAGFLPYVKLQGSSSTLVKKNEIQQGNYALCTGKDRFTDLGPSVKALVLDWRPKAVDFKAKINVYDPESTEFASIRERSEIPKSRCSAGNEFLIYLPQEKVFATLHMTSKTEQREAAKLEAMLGHAIRLESQLFDNGENSWWGPIILACTDAMPTPAQEDIIEQVRKFRNPPQKEVSQDEGEEAPATAGRVR